MTELRVLIFVSYPFAKIAGNLRTLLYILRFAPAHGIRCVVVAPFDTELSERVRALGAEWIVVPPPASINRYGGQVLRESLWARLRSSIDLLRYNMRIRRLIREQRIDLVYCDGIRSMMFTGLGGLLARVPRVMYMNGQFDNPLLDRIGMMLATRLLFICEANRDDRYPEMIRRYADKIGIVGYGLDLDDIRQAEARGPAVDGVRAGLGIVCVGQLYEPKGVHWLIEAFGRVAPKYPDATLYLVGDPVVREYEPYVDELRSQIARLGLGDRVVFTGWRDDALALVSRLDILVHPSRSEGFGRAVLEAMALGKPVIASRVGGLRELIHNSVSGYLVEPADVASIAARLDTLLGDAQARATIARAAKATVEAGYQIDDKVEEMYRIWRESVAS
jgi:L-malate glycosyltransferase